MNKLHIAHKVAKDCGISQDKATEVVDCVFATVMRAVAGGEDVLITHFGTFRNRFQVEHFRRNPQNDEPIRVPAGAVVRFAPHDRFRDAVRNKDQSVVLKKAPKSS